MDYPDLTIESTNASWIDYKIMLNTWMSGEDEIVFDDVLWHPDSLKSGWLKIAKGFYDFQYDESFGIISPRPTKENQDGIKSEDKDYKRAYQATLYIKETGTVTWTASNVGNKRSWENAYHTFNQTIKDNPGKVAYLKKGESIPDDSGKGFTRSINWSLVSWVDAPDDFILKEDQPEESPNISNNTPVADSDDIPF